MAVTGLLGKNLFSNTGLINDLLVKIGVVGPEWLVDTSTALAAVIVMNCWVGIPFNMLLLISGLTSIPGEVYESASIDGARWGQRFVYITLPMMRGSIMAVLMLGWVGYDTAAAVQSAAAITGIKALCVLMPGIFVIGSWLAFTFVWNITPEIREKMAQSKGGQSA